MKKTVLSLMMTAAVAAGAASAQTYAITNARLLMVGDADSPRTVANGTMIIRNGRIAALGASVSVPEGVEVVDAGGMPVTPGLFGALSGLGLEEISLNREGNDRSARESVGIVAAMNATDGLYADSTVIPISRSGGVTRALSALDPGSELISGCAAIIDLAGGTNPVTQNCAANYVSFGYRGARTVGDSRPAAMSAFRGILEDVKTFEEDPFLYRRLSDERRLSERDAEALLPILQGKRKLLVEVNGASDIRRVLDLSEEYGLDIVLVGAAEAHRLANEIAAAGVPVIINPMSNLPGSFETFGSSLKSAGILSKAGVEVALYDSDIGFTHNLRLLPQLAGNAVANGMPYGDALAAISAVPAEIYGLDDRLGTLQVGKIADVVVWNGDPLEVTTRPTHVFIDGKATSMDNRQKALARRYRDLTPSDMPFAYRGE